MAAMDISALSIPELEQLLTSIPLVIKERKAAQKDSLRKELEAKAAEMGFSLEELFQKAPKPTKKVSSRVKYRHPNNPSLTWSGHGRKPRWYVEFLEGGGTVEQLTAA